MPRKSKKPVIAYGRGSAKSADTATDDSGDRGHETSEWVRRTDSSHLLLKEDAEEIAGPKGKHEKGRTHNHWGSTNGELSFGGRRIQVSRSSSFEVGRGTLRSLSERIRIDPKFESSLGLVARARVPPAVTSSQTEEARGIPVSAAGVV